jgi:uncharacterized alkaline shock family protein YloU
MTDHHKADGLTIAPGVIETILVQAILQVDGVARVGLPKPTDGFFSGGRKRNPAQGITLIAEDEQITATVHVSVYYGFRLQELAEALRYAVAETLEGQIGITASAVDIFIDSVVFPE